jgi:hypothetical protein
MTLNALNDLDLVLDVTNIDCTHMIHWPPAIELLQPIFLFKVWFSGVRQLFLCIFVRIVNARESRLSSYMVFSRKIRTVHNQWYYIVPFTLPGQIQSSNLHVSIHTDFTAATIIIYHKHYGLCLIYGGLNTGLEVDPRVAHMLVRIYKLDQL